MPDLTPSLEILRKLGLSMPQAGAAPSNEQVDLNDLLARVSQQNDPNWKKAARIGIGSLVGGTKGLLGIDPSEDVKKRIISGNATPDEKAEWYSSGATQMGQGIADAGLPFAAYGNKVFHGAPVAFDKFNPAQYDKHDVLGWLTHFAEDANYADHYASGMKRVATAPNMIAAHPQAKNVLDLVSPNMDDLSQVIASIPKGDWHRQDLISTFKEARKNPEAWRERLSQTHYPKRSEIPADEIPAFAVSEALRLKPGGLERTPFDAIRYNDMDKKSWAIPETTPINTAWGVPMNDTPKDLKVTRLPDDAPIKSELTVNKTPEPVEDWKSAHKFAAEYNAKKHKDYQTYEGWTVQDPFSKEPQDLNEYADQVGMEPHAFVKYIKNNPDMYEGTQLIAPSNKPKSILDLPPEKDYSQLTTQQQADSYTNDLISAYGLPPTHAKALVDNSSFNEIKGLLKGDVSGYLKQHPEHKMYLPPSVTGIIPNKTDYTGWTISTPHSGPHDLKIYSDAYTNGDMSINKFVEHVKNNPDNWEKLGYKLHEPEPQDQWGVPKSKQLNPPMSQDKHQSLLEDANKLGLDVMKFSTTDELKSAVSDAWDQHYGQKAWEGPPAFNDDVHDLGNAEDYSKYFEPYTKEELAKSGQKPWDSKVK